MSGRTGQFVTSPTRPFKSFAKERPVRWIKKIRQDGTIELTSVEIKPSE